jgi:hypothetical protein
VEPDYQQLNSTIASALARNAEIARQTSFRRLTLHGLSLIRLRNNFADVL